MTRTILILPLLAALAAGDAGVPPLRDPALPVEGAMDLDRLRPRWTAAPPGSAWTDPALDAWASHLRRQLRTAAASDPVIGAAWLFVERSPGAVAVISPTGGVAAAFRLPPADAQALAAAMPGDDALIGDWRGRGRGVLAAVARTDTLAVGPLPLLRTWLTRAQPPETDPAAPLWLRAAAGQHLQLLEGVGGGPVLDHCFPGWERADWRIDVEATPAWEATVRVRGAGAGALIPLGGLAALPRPGADAFLAAGLPPAVVEALLAERLPGIAPAGAMALAVRIDGPLLLTALAVPLAASAALPAPDAELAGRPAATIPGPWGPWLVQERDGWLLAGSDHERLAAWAVAPRTASATTLAVAELASARLYQALVPWIRLGIGRGLRIGRDPAEILAQVAPALAGFPDPEAAAGELLPIGRGAIPVSALLPLLRLCAGAERVPGRVSVAAVGRDGPVTILRTRAGWHPLVRAPRDGAELPPAITDAALADLLATQPAVLAQARALVVLDPPPMATIDGRCLPDPTLMARHLPDWRMDLHAEGGDLIARETGLPLLTVAVGIAGFLPGFYGAPVPGPVRAPAPSGRVEEF
jgi:hypothetical protein